MEESLTASGINVLSVFDGMSCGQIALKIQSIRINKYYASEIDKFAIQQTIHNFPKTILLGDIQKIKAKNLEKIDFFIGGSPCQGFSFAGKQLNFEDPRSSLFFEYVRLWNEIKAINPEAKFLLENVNMKKEYLRVISEYLGVFPVRINSNLVSAQNRDRWYWTNIKIKETGLFNEVWSDIPPPKDKGILLKDILQPDIEVDGKYYTKSTKYRFNNIESGGVLSMNGTLINTDIANCIDANYYKGIDNHQQRTGVCIRVANKVGSIRMGRNSKAKAIRHANIKRGKKDHSPHTEKKITGIDFDKSNPLISSTMNDNLLTDGYKLRRLTPIECCRLQTIPEWYKWIVSDTQIYKMLGNGWTVDIISHIFSFLNYD